MGDSTEESNNYFSEPLPPILNLYIRDLPTIRFSCDEEHHLVLLKQAGLWAEQRLRGNPHMDIWKRQLFERLVTDGKWAQDLLVLSQLHWVLNIVFSHSFPQAALPLLDRIQEGNLALIRAAEKFDSALNIRFSTYVRWRVYKAIYRAEIREWRQAGYIPPIENESEDISMNKETN